jgi:hypothetical protein
VEQFDILYGASLPEKTEEWTWEHVPLNHLSPEFAYHRHVCAVQNLKVLSTEY